MRIVLDHSRNVIVIDDEPNDADRAYAAESSPFRDLDPQADEPTPAEALADATDYDAWPEWAQTERWALAEEPEAFALPAGVGRATATRVSPEEEGVMWGRPRPGDARLIDRLGRRDGYPPA